MTKPISILIAAMGGEGGAVLADWLVDASMQGDFPVQSTSVPGVAQRTGATTYYIEIFPRPRGELGGKEPVLSLAPTPGQVDVVAATEFVEAGRAIQNGYVDPRRTTLVASTHREYAVSEKSAIGDGRYESERILDAATRRSQRAVLLDMRALAQQHGTVINTVLFGALSGSGVLPFDRATCLEAIRRSGKAVEASLRGFAAGFDACVARARSVERLDETLRSPVGMTPPVAALPVFLHEVVAAGVALTSHYQDSRYADLYLERVGRLSLAEAVAGPNTFETSREAARYLALWMSYEDVIRVAQLKSNRGRLARIRREMGASDGDCVRITDYLKPGLDEVLSLLPPRASTWLRAKTQGKAWHRPMHLRTDTVRGMLMLCLLRSLRPLRRVTSRYAEEQELIERWLSAVQGALPDPLALEIALCGNLIKGYGETNARGRHTLEAILEQVAAGADASWVHAARLAALADHGGAHHTANPHRPVEQPIRIVRRRSAT